jgi:hypothetical protein
VSTLHLGGADRPDDHQGRRNTGNRDHDEERAAGGGSTIHGVELGADVAPCRGRRERELAFPVVSSGRGGAEVEVECGPDGRTTGEGHPRDAIAVVVVFLAQLDGLRPHDQGPALEPVFRSGRQAQDVRGEDHRDAVTVKGLVSHHKSHGTEHRPGRERGTARATAFARAAGLSAVRQRLTSADVDRPSSRPWASWAITATC